MQKYKVVASKSHKKYTIIVSADSEIEAKEKIHKENYSILSVGLYKNEEDISGKKFIFQVEKNGNIQNGIIIGVDIFKIYIKLKDELEYHVIFLYPEGDDAENNAQKKQDIMTQLEQGYELQKKTIQFKQQQKGGEENFYIKKKLDETYILIQKVISKIELLLEKKEEYSLSGDRLNTLQKVYESLIHMKGSTNLSKLKEIGELALVKIAQIELESLELQKNEESRALLKNTNELLKKIGSKQQFIESNKDIKKIFQDILGRIKAKITGISQLQKVQKIGNQENYLDKESYNFLKTLLLLEKYKEKLLLNTKEIRGNKKIFLNPFFHSEFKDKVLLKRKVIQQNISILKAKKTGTIRSYTSIKKGYHKIIESIFSYTAFLEKTLLFCICIYCFIFLISIFSNKFFGGEYLILNTQNFSWSLSFFLLYLVFLFSKNIFLLSINIVFFLFFSIFMGVNF